MKPTNQGNTSPKGPTPNRKQDATNPGKPNNDPDQTPDREVENDPKAKPAKTQEKNKIGFKK